jgi:hypothetical protein
VKSVPGLSATATVFRPDCVKALKTAKRERTGIAQPLTDPRNGHPFTLS